LAHGGTLLNAVPDPIGAIRWFEDIRTFAERLWAYPLTAQQSGRVTGGREIGATIAHPEGKL
jgi:hypothetical protein